MAEFKGFGYTSPEEIRANTIAGFQQAMASGNVNAMRMAVAQMGAFGAAGSPELRKAEKTKKVFTAAQKAADMSGDEVADEMAFLREVQRLAVEAELPEVALQATGQLSTWRLQEDERARLKAKETREAELHGRTKEQWKKEDEIFGLGMQTKGRYVVVDGNGEYIDIIDVTTPEGQATRSELINAGTPHAMVTEEDWFAEISDQKLAQQKLKDDLEDSSLPDTTKNRFNQLAIGQATFRTAIDQLVDIIDESPQGLSATGKTKGVLERVGSEGRQFAASNGQTEEDAQRIIANAARKNNIAVERISGAVINLAYALASSREGGKLSESDIELALATLGVNGQPDPAAALTVLRDVVERNSNTWSQIPDTIIDFRGDPSAMKVWGVQDQSYKDLLTKFDTTIDKWSNKRKQSDAADAVNTAGDALNILYPGN